MKLGTFQAHIDEMCRQKKISLEEAAEPVYALGIHVVCVGADSIGNSAQERERLERVGFHIDLKPGNHQHDRRQDCRAAIHTFVAVWMAAVGLLAGNSDAE